MRLLPCHEPVFSASWRETFGRVDEALTRVEVEFLRRVLPLPDFRRVLDVPCGAGRHMAALDASGYETVGIDNEPSAVAEARAAGVDARVGDMRDLKTLGRDFDAVVNMWASFGWFDEATNVDVLRGFAARLRPGGRLVLDLSDPDFFLTRQGVRDNKGVRDRKTIVDRRLRTELDYPSGERDVFEWQLFAPEELAAAAQLDLLLACAGFDEAEPPRGESPRMQVVLARPLSG